MWTWLRRISAADGILPGLVRWLLAFWLGLASMFVLLVIRLAISGKFETILFDQLILLLFPVYYLTSFGLLLSSFILQILLLMQAQSKVNLAGVAIQLFCLLILVIDYFWVYEKLTDMLLPLGSPRPQNFRFYHRLTETLNLIVFAGVLLQSLIYGKKSEPG